MWVLTEEEGTSTSSNSARAPAPVSHGRVYIRLALVAQAMFALGGGFCSTKHGQVAGSVGKEEKLVAQKRKIRNASPQGELQNWGG